VPVLRAFLNRKSPNFTCRLVQHHHAKVVWWRGAGAYIGSANLTDSAWHTNIEAGCFFPEAEIDDSMAGDLHALFDKLEEQATSLTEELLEVMIRRAKALQAAMPDARSFWASPSLRTWPGLGHIATKSTVDTRRQAFLKEWHATLQDLRDIGALVSLPENRPTWVDAASPAGAQADQFLHAHYYNRAMDGRKANHPALFEKNKGRR
jgi:phosphatidylserine/phosphatidylglycerophosphate/cardiolipin synthase-like enzyme